MDYDFYLDKVLYNYLDLENKFITTIQYVSLDTKNFDVFSNQLTNQILANCSELENLFRYILKEEICEIKKTNRKSKKNGKKKINININLFLSLLEKDQSWKDIFIEEVIVIRNEKISIKPFANLDRKNSTFLLSPFWWTAYNNLKHNRYKENNLGEGNLKNVLYSLSRLFITIMYFHYIKFSNLNGRLHYPDERSRLFKLKNLEDNKHILFFSQYEEYPDT